MEVVLLVSFPTKRKFKRLRLEVQALPEPLIGHGLFPSIIGLNFYKTDFCIQQPLPHQSNPRGSVFFMHIQDSIWKPTLSEHLCGGSSTTLLESLSYRWVIPYLRSNLLESSGWQLSQTANRKMQVSKSRNQHFECGKGIYVEDLLLGHPQLVDLLHEVRNEHAELKGVEGMTLSFDDTTYLLRLELTGNRGLWTVDTTTWDAVPSEDLEPWCTLRLDQALADPYRAPQLFTELANHFQDSVHNQIYMLRFLNYWLQEEFSLVAIGWKLGAEIKKFMKWLIIIEKYLAKPLGEVLTKNKYQVLVKPALKYQKSFFILSQSKHEFTLHETFGKLIDECIGIFGKIRQSSEADRSALYNSFCNHIYCMRACEVVRKLRDWAEFSASKPSIWRSMRRRLKKRERSWLSLDYEPRELPLTTATLKSLHDRLSKLSLSTVKKPLTTTCCPLYVADEHNHHMRPMEEFLGFWVMWMTTSHSGLVFVHVKSKEAPHQEYLVELLPNQPSCWREISGTPFDYKGENSWQHVYFSLVSSHSIWIIVRLLDETGHYLVSRICISETLVKKSNIAIPRLVWVHPKLSPELRKPKLMAIDECLIMVSDWAGPEFNETNCCIPLQFFKYRHGFSEITAPEYLRDRTSANLIKNFHKVLPSEKDWGSSRIVSTRNTRRFLGFREHQNHHNHLKPKTEHVTCAAIVRLGLFRLNISRGEYSLIHFQHWNLNIKSTDHFHPSGDLSTFVVGPKEYLLYFHHYSRMLIAYDTSRMMMVFIEGSPLHKLPRTIGVPIQMLGCTTARNPFAHFAQSYDNLSGRPEYQLLQLKYRPIRL